MDKKGRMGNAAWVRISAISVRVTPFFFALFQMMLEGGIRQPLRHECRYRHNGTIPQGKLVLTAPYLPKEHIVIQLREFRGEFPLPL